MNEKRIEKLTEVLRKLNTDGATEETRREALDIVSNIDPIELSIAEQKLIEEGMKPHDLRHLCEIHMEVLSDELVKLKRQLEPGHMLDILIIEHEKIKELLTELDELNIQIQKLENFENNEDYFVKLKVLAENILDAENHHRREERVLFPELENRNITGPTRIMRMEHDDLRAKKRTLKQAAETISNANFNEQKSIINDTSKYIVFYLRDHIYKENYILYPTAIDAIKEKELWAEMKRRADEIGYCGFTPKM